jgi:hypothetical protein
MKVLNQIIFSLLLLSPFSVLASGQEVIVVAFFELTLILIFSAILWTLKLNIKGKLLMMIIYLLSTYLTFLFVNTGAYFENLILINVSIAVIPSIIVSGAYLLMKNKFKKI